MWKFSYCVFFHRRCSSALINGVAAKILAFWQYDHVCAVWKEFGMKNGLFGQAFLGPKKETYCDEITGQKRFKGDRCKQGVPANRQNS